MPSDGPIEEESRHAPLRYEWRWHACSMPRWRVGPALSVDAVWLRSGRILLVRRRRAPFQGRWALPGGFVERDETVEEAVARELTEETGLIARPIQIVGVYSGPDRDPRKPVTTIAFRMAGHAGPPTGNDDAAEARWVPLTEVGHLAFDHNRIVADALHQLRRRPARPRTKRD
jgi:8-oxo-dGTP diphosphatase